MSGTWSQVKLDGSREHAVDCQHEVLSAGALHEGVGWLAEAGKHDCVWEKNQSILFLISKNFNISG